jgi:hypothetical protein
VTSPKIVALLLAAVALLAGCQRTIDNTRVSAVTPARLTLWTSQAANDLPAETSAQIRDALNEFKLSIYRLGKASAPADIEDHLCAEVHNLTVRTLLIRGCELKEARLQIERDIYQQLHVNQLASRADPADPHAARYLEFQRESSKKRLDSLNAALSENARRLGELRQPAPKP